VHDTERKQSVESESAILVRVNIDGSVIIDEPLAELHGLATTAGVKVAGEMTQRRDRPDMTTYIGKGKVEELQLFVESRDADMVIFDNDLSPAQIRNLEKAVCVKVLDRTELILDIFATHARTYESRLAVELAQLEYALPRLKNMWSHLSRLKMGVGMRGPGEKQLEVDRRLVEKRISDLRGELKEIEQRKEREVAGRKETRTVSLVGYTNAGKSTLMNSLTGAGVFAEDKLFATLDTRTRRWQLPNWGPVLLSDTVGFIRDLPHKLIASFKATLAETRHADLLVHVADGSNPAVFDQIAAVYTVLEELGIEAKDTLLVVNKIDQIDTPSRLDGILNRYPNSIAISAHTQAGFEQFSIAVSDALSRAFIEAKIETSVGNGRLMAYIADKGEVFSREFNDETAVIHCRLPAKALGKIDPATATITRIEPEDAFNRHPPETGSDSSSETGEAEDPAGNVA